MKVTILDLDNCISNDGWRKPTIKHHIANLDERFLNYHLNSIFDEFVNGHIIDGAGALIIFTARPDKFRIITEKWMRRNGIEVDRLCMRKAGDHRPSLDVKLDMLLDEMIEWQLEGIQLDDIIAYDDRQDIVDMYINNGIKAEVLRINKY
jgi:hypothetical protein